MRNSSDKRRIAPLACAAVAVVFFGLLLVLVLLPLLDIGGDWVLAVTSVLCALIILAVIVGVLVALRQRLWEIEGGEEEDASQY